MPRVQDLTGQRFGRLTVLNRVGTRNGNSYWHCRCDCGNEKDVSFGNLKYKHVLSCGCLNKELTRQRNSKDLTGQRFGRLTVLNLDRYEKRTGFWNCKCDCGNEVQVRTGDLTSGNTLSCGCLREENRNKIRNDLTGKTFGRLTVVGLANVPEKHGTYWHCKCECGNEVDVPAGNLVGGQTKSCGCLQREAASAANSSDLTGQRFGMLTALYKTDSHVTSGGNSLATWHCRCDCGNEKDVTAGNLLTGNTQSCGCVKQSLGEVFVDEILGGLNVIYESQVKFPGLVGLGDYPLSYDFGIFDEDKTVLCLIECQGQQHYEPVDYFGGNSKYAVQVLYDGLKKEYADEVLQVPIIEVPYWIKRKSEIKDFLTERLKDCEVIFQ